MDIQYFDVRSVTYKRYSIITEYLTIIRPRRGDYRGIFTETKSRYYFVVFCSIFTHSSEYKK